MEIELLTVEEMMKKFKVSKVTIYNWIKTGLPSIKMGRTLRFDSKEVMEWVDRNRRVKTETGD